MQISALRAGESKRKLDSTVDACTKLNNNILRLTLTDRSGKINLILEGTSLVRENKNVGPGSKISLKNFTVTNNIDPIRKQFPRLIDPVQFIAHETSKRDFIYYNQRSHPNCVMDIKVVESQSQEIRPLKLAGPAGESYVSLQFISSNVTSDQACDASAFGVVLNVSGFYKTKNQDFVTTLHVTDASIYPKKVKLSVYTIDVTKITKVAGVGDVIQMKNIKWSQRNEKMVGTIGRNHKWMSYYLFPISGSNVPYGQFGERFGYLTEEDSQSLQETRHWSQSLPLTPKSLQADTNGVETDKMLRIYTYMKMGIEKHDPYIVFAYDERNSYSMVLDNMRANFLLKWIEGGKTARFRSVILKENTIIPTIFTEILLIPNYYNRLQIDSNPRIEDRLQQSAQLFQPAAPHAKVTQVAREHRMQEVASFKSEQGLRRIQGYVVNVDPYAPGKKGYKCPVDKK